MEELSSTEALNKEILEDARKKAHETLKAADDNLEAQKREWNEKLISDLDHIRKTYAEKTKTAETDILARLPLDKRRMRSETAERYMLKAMDDFLGSLTREELLSVLEKELAGRLRTWAGSNKEAAKNFAEKKFSAEVRYSGLSINETRDILKKISPTGNFEITEDMTVHKLPSIEINIENIKIRASVGTLSDNLLKSKRAELAAALMGEGVLND